MMMMVISLSFFLFVVVVFVSGVVFQIDCGNEDCCILCEIVLSLLYWHLTSLILCFVCIWEFVLCKFHGFCSYLGLLHFVWLCVLRPGGLCKSYGGGEAIPQLFRPHQCVGLWHCCELVCVRGWLIGEICVVTCPAVLEKVVGSWLSSLFWYIHILWSQFDFEFWGPISSPPISE